jgi:hypothetical protein
MVIPCPYCGKTLQINDSLAGKRVTCPILTCKKSFIVPGIKSVSKTSYRVTKPLSTPVKNVSTSSSVQSSAQRIQNQQESTQIPPIPPPLPNVPPPIKQPAREAKAATDDFGYITISTMAGLARKIKTQAKRLSLAVFGLSILCFFLPFIHISCQGKRIETFKGIHLIVGKEITEVDMSFLDESHRRPTRQRVEPELFAILAFLCASGGLALSFLKGKGGSIGGGLVAAVGIFTLLLLKLRIDSTIAKEGEGLLQVEYGAGFYITFLLFLCAAILNLSLLINTKKQLWKGNIRFPL